MYALNDIFALFKADLFWFAVRGFGSALFAFNDIINRLLRGCFLCRSFLFAIFLLFRRCFFGRRGRLDGLCVLFLVFPAQLCQAGNVNAEKANEKQ